MPLMNEFQSAAASYSKHSPSPHRPDASYLPLGEKWMNGPLWNKWSLSVWHLQMNLSCKTKSIHLFDEQWRWVSCVGAQDCAVVIIAQSSGDLRNAKMCCAQLHIRGVITQINIKKKEKKFKGWFKIFSSIAGKVIMMCSWSQNVLSREILTGDVSCWTIEDTVNLLQLPVVLLSQWGCHAGLTRTPEPSQDCTEQLSTIQLNTNHFDYSLRKTFSDSSFLNVKMICFLSSSRTVNWLWPKQDIWGRHLRPFYDFL